MLENLINLAMLELKSTVKNPASKAKLKKVVLKAFNTIKTLYADDPDFE